MCKVAITRRSENSGPATSPCACPRYRWRSVIILRPASLWAPAITFFVTSSKESSPFTKSIVSRGTDLLLRSCHADEGRSGDDGLLEGTGSPHQLERPDGGFVPFE
ncbi:hypothetical protein PENTCL1PPCAC_23880 [Pristionchus entomophagus]|uniref:Ribosomal protein n=1 Tax=Pristionchus entomophagus TaxID=358040 RepID=A0AAV5U495_9BILA|nr:hypothetical protein PENTCL1PPCAC_23880 [Pristionchus entomophagus]